MNIKREWATPITAGAFILLSITGMLMFFHLDSGLNKTAHEWLSWALITGVLLHVTANFSAFKKHLSNRKTQAIIGTFTLILLLSFLSLGGEEGDKKFAPPIRALANAPLTTVAMVAKITPEQLLERLEDDAGISADSDKQSVSELVGGDLRKQISVLTTLLQNSK